MTARSRRRWSKYGTTVWESRRESDRTCSSGSSARTRILKATSTERDWVSALSKRRPLRWEAEPGLSSMRAVPRSTSRFRVAGGRTRAALDQPPQSRRLPNRTVKSQRVRHAKGVVPPLLVIVQESFSFHRRFELLPIHCCQPTRVRRVSCRREGVERGSHLELLPGNEVDQREIDCDAEIVTRAAGDVAVGEQIGSMNAVGPFHHRKCRAHWTIGIEDLERDPARAQIALDTNKRCPSFSPQARVVGQITR